MLRSLVIVDRDCAFGGKETGASACTVIVHAIRETDIATSIDLRVVKELEDFMLYAKALQACVIWR